MHSATRVADVVNVRITHKTARVPLLEAVSFKDQDNAYEELRSLDGVEESVLIQTCNRVELYLVSEHSDRTVKSAVTYLEKRASTHCEETAKAIEYAVNHDALNHLLRVTSGLESMVIGEDQVINQVWNAYLEAEKAKAAGPILSLLFNRAVNVGREVRRETGIGRGAVSVGSATVELAANILGDLKEKKILVMGAGETGTLVAKAMARRCLTPIFIANRTYERAFRLAGELGGKAVKFDKLGEAFIDADVVFCCTSAPHYLLTKELISWLMLARRNKGNLLIIDVSNPRNVEQAVGELPKVTLRGIDDLELIADRNLRARQRSVEKASGIVDGEVSVLERAIKEDSVDDVVSELLSRVEKKRRRELSKALKMIGDVDERHRKIVNDLTSILVKQTLLPVVENFRRAAGDNDTALVEAAAWILDVEP